jgi:hypothetical protein
VSCGLEGPGEPARPGGGSTEPSPVLPEAVRARDALPAGADQEVRALHPEARGPHPQLTRRSYGLREYDTLELVLYHTPGHLALPAHIHRFW